MRNFENKEKIMKASGVLQFVCGWVVLGAALKLILNALWPILYLMRHHHSPAPSSPAFHDTFWFWLELPYPVLECLAWINLWTFFGKLKAGFIFDASSVSRLSTAGKYMLAGAVYLYVFEFIRYLLDIPTVNGPVQLSDTTETLLAGLTTGLTIILAAWLLREGQTMEEEQKLTV